MPSELSLPTKRSEPANSLSDFSMLLFGREKIGKTTFAAQFPKPLFLCFEEGTKALAVYKRSVKTWKEAKGYLKLLREQEHDFSTIVIDTADIAYAMCLQHVCFQEGMDHPSDEDFGKGWSAVNDEFNKWVLGLCGLGIGVIFISHSRETEIKRLSGRSSHRVHNSMPRGARSAIEPQVDIIAYYGFNEISERTIQIVGDDLIAAGHRIKGRFKGVTTIQAGKSEEETYQHFVEAFDNKYKAKGLKDKIKLLVSSSTKGKDKKAKE